MARSKQQQRDEDPSKYAGQSSQEIDDDMGFLDGEDMTGTEGGEAGSETTDRQRSKSRNRKESDQEQNQDDEDSTDENLF